MARTALIGAVVTLTAAFVAALGGTIGITNIWPVLLAVAVGLAGGVVTLGRIGALVVGTLAAWIALALDAGALPQTPLAAALAVLVGVGIVAAIAALTRDIAPLWAGLAGYAAFTGYYTPLYEANPTLFLTESPVALLTVLLAGGIGLTIAALAEMVAPPERAAQDHHEPPAMLAEEGAR